MRDARCRVGHGFDARDARDTGDAPARRIGTVSSENGLNAAQHGDEEWMMKYLTGGGGSRGGSLATEEGGEDGRVEQLWVRNRNCFIYARRRVRKPRNTRMLQNLRCKITKWCSRARFFERFY